MPVVHDGVGPATDVLEDVRCSESQLVGNRHHPWVVRQLDATRRPRQLGDLRQGRRQDRQLVVLEMKLSKIRQASHVVRQPP